MKLIRFFEQEHQQTLIDAIGACDWSAARFLAELLRKGSFCQTLGGWGQVYLFMDGQDLVSFCTLTGQDTVQDPDLTPWIGFVFTQPDYRGKGYAGQILAAAEADAAGMGYNRVYLETDHVGLYERYGYEYMENRIDIWGADVRILSKSMVRPA